MAASVQIGGRKRASERDVIYGRAFDRPLDERRLARRQAAKRIKFANKKLAGGFDRHAAVAATATATTAATATAVAGDEPARGRRARQMTSSVTTRVRSCRDRKPSKVNLSLRPLRTAIFETRRYFDRSKTRVARFFNFASFLGTNRRK